MPAILEIEPKTEQGNWIDFKVFIVEKNAKKYTNGLEKAIYKPENLDLIHEIDENFKFEDLKIYEKDKIILIISSFKEKWQENTVREIIKRAKENKSKILLIALNDPPLEFKSEIYTFKAQDEKQLLLIPKILIGSVYFPSLVCNSPEDIHELLIKDYGEINYYLYENKVNNIDEYEEFIQNRLPKNIFSMLIYVEMHPINQVMIADKMVFIAKNLVNPEHIVFDIWIDERLKEEKIKIHFVVFK